MNRPRIQSIRLLVALGVSGFQLHAASDGLPRGCNEMPYVRYEAEAGAIGGGAVERAALDFDANQTASEASNRHYVALPVNGAYLQWTVNQSADGAALRFTLPDNAAGTGVTGSLDIHVNGAYSTTINLGSYWAWTYFLTPEPTNTPGTRPRMRFDEIRFRLPVKLQPGDVVKITKSNGDAYEYGLDFLELEAVPDVLSKPAGFVSVTDYGANGNDALSDSAAFDSAWQAAKNAGTGLYIPPGKFVLDRRWNLGDSSGLAIQGAGIWFTELFFSQKTTGAGGLRTGKNTTAITISHFYMNSALNERHIVAGQVADYKAFNGPLGAGSSIRHVWITHFEVGAWIADYTSPAAVTTGFDFAHNRVRYTYADGINFAQGTNTGTVRQCDFRSTGDDSMAVWPSAAAGAPEGHSNVFRNNTVEFTYRAAGAGIFGGYGHEIHHCLFKDVIDSAGIRFTEDFSGYHFENNTDIRVYENTLAGCGTSQDLWNNSRGAIEIYGAGIQNLIFEDNLVLDSPRHAVQLSGGQNLNFNRTTITNTGLDSFNTPAGAAIFQYGGAGSAAFVVLDLSGIERSPSILQDNPAYVLTVSGLNRPPVAANDTASVAKGVAREITVLANDSDPDLDPLTILSVNNGAHGTVTHNGSLVSYAPDPGFAGLDSFNYTVSDARGGTAAASVAVNVHEVLAPSPYEMEISFTGYTRAEELARFPVLVKLGPQRSGFSYAQFVSENGDDLRFRDTDHNELNYEIESWNPAGTSTVWVQLPSLTSSTRIWAAWGSSSLATKPAYTTNGAVWAEGYAAVYHASEATGTRRDSTAGARHGTPLGNTSGTAGMISGADQFDGNGDAVRLPGGFGLFGGTQNLTVEFWFKADSFGPGTFYGTSPVLFQARAENSWMITLGDSAPADALSPRLNQGGWATPASATGLQTGRWYHYSTTYSSAGANNWKVYLDGALMAQGTRTGAVTAESALKNQYGGSDESGAGINRWFQGAMDEVRISSASRSENWLWATWQTVQANETFATYGAVQTIGTRYAFVAAASAGGNVAGSASGDYLAGSSVSINANAAPYYHWSHWAGDILPAQAGQNPLTLTMDGNRTVTAMFEANLTARGVPEWWLAGHGWTTDFDTAAEADTDADGLSAWQEYLAGTDPTNSASALRAAIAPAPSNAALLLSWTSVSGKTYRIEKTANVADWTTSGSNIPATPPLNIREEPLPASTPVFFRIVVEP